MARIRIVEVYSQANKNRSLKQLVALLQSEIYLSKKRTHLRSRLTLSINAWMRDLLMETMMMKMYIKVMLRISKL